MPAARTIERDMAAAVLRTRFQCGTAVLVVLAGLHLGCARDPENGASALPAKDRAGDGHERMVATLRAVAERTDEENSFLGGALRRAAGKALADLPPGATA